MKIRSKLFISVVLLLGCIDIVPSDAYPYMNKYLPCQLVTEECNKQAALFGKGTWFKDPCQAIEQMFDTRDQEAGLSLGREIANILTLDGRRLVEQIMPHVSKELQEQQKEEILKALSKNVRQLR